MEFDYKTLELLRDHTTLDPISYLKVLKERRIANETQYIINQLEHCQLGVDYSKANQLEAWLRFKVWCSDVLSVWHEFGGSQELNEFALRLLYQQEERKKKRVFQKRV